MAVSTGPGGTTITGEDVELFRMRTLRRGLRMEIEIGLKMSNSYSPLQILQREGITTKRTKRAAYADLDRHCVSLGLESLPLKS